MFVSSLLFATIVKSFVIEKVCYKYKMEFYKKVEFYNIK